jgi:hypothetical protein
MAAPMTGPAIISLVTEYLAAMRQMRLGDAHRLTAHGIPMRSITIAYPAPMRVRRTGERYHLDAAGAAAYVMPV